MPKPSLALMAQALTIIIKSNNIYINMYHLDNEMKNN